MTCETCVKGEAHYHIIVEQGKVTEVWYLSADGYWDRDLQQDEYFVEYPDDPKHVGSVRKIKVRSGKKRTSPAVNTPRAGEPDADDWLQPKVYKGKSMHQVELDRLGKK
jgi:hypothetical protein